jgi:hypothetical protein
MAVKIQYFAGINEGKGKAPGGAASDRDSDRGRTQKKVQGIPLKLNLIAWLSNG